MVVMFWSYRVPDWDAWASSLRFMNEEDEQARARREKYGMLRRWVYRSVDDPNEVMMVAEFTSRRGAEALLQDPEGMRRWNERTGLEVFPPVLITEEVAELDWARSSLGERPTPP
jgi:quinol monooxygenase YgiN